MAEISTIRAQIARVRQELVASPVFTLGRPDKASKAGEESARLERLAESVRIIIRDLNSAESFIHIREDQLPKLPHDQRYSARQSLTQMSQNVHALRDDAQSLAELIRDLLDRNGLLNPLQKTKSILDLSKDLDKLAGHDAHALVAQALQAPKHDAVSAAHLNGPSMSVGGVVNVIAFVYLGIKVLQKKLGSKSTSA